MVIISMYCTLARQLLSDLGKKDFPVFRGSQRDKLSLSEMLSAGAAFQHSFTVQQFASFFVTAWTDYITLHYCV